MEILINLPFFPGFDDEASYSLYEYPDPGDRAIEEIMYSIEEMGLDELITERDLYFDQDRYEAAAKSAWIEEWKKQAPKNVVKSVIAESGGRFNANYAYAHVTLVDGWQDVMSAFMQDNETWLKEDCGLEEDFDNWPKYLFEDQDEERIADMIGFMMLQDNDEIRMDLIGEVFNKVSADSYVFLDEWRLGKLLDEGDEPDEEMRVLNNVKKWYVALTADDSVGDEFIKPILDSILDFVRDKYECEWYKNYLGTKKITFDGPTNYKETGDITYEDISDFMSGAWNNFLTHRLIVGHTERQDRFTAFIRDYPLEILDWLKDSLPYTFYKGLAKGGEYELYGFSKDEFIDILSDIDNSEEKGVFEYAAVLEENYGIDYAVDYLKALDWHYWYWEELIDHSNGTAIFIIEMLSRAASLSDNSELEEDIRHLGDLAITRKDGRFGLDFSIKMYARLADMWKKGLIGDDWLVDKDCDDGLACQIDYEWGDVNWGADGYPECPDEHFMRVWLIKLLESNFANDIADYLKPLLEMVLQKEKDHNWETGKKAIESFLAKTSNK